MMNIHRVRRSWLLLAYWIFALMLPFALMSVSSSAQASGSCWLSGPALNFGSVSGKGKTSYTNWQVTCNQYGHTKTVNVALCPYATAGGLGLSNNRRQMVAYGATHSYLKYDLFYDPALTQRIDTQANLSTLKCSYKTFNVNENKKVFDLPIYGHVYAGQNVRAANYDNNNNTQVTLLYAFSQDKQPSIEDVLASKSSNQSNSLNVMSNYENSCNLISASDLNFGQINDLSQVVTSSTTVALSCPLNTSWKVNLDQGMNYDGATRRMRKGADYIAYELYRDAQYSQLWNNSGASQGTGNNGTQTINIYGKAGPSLTAVPAGEYQDTITVTLTY
ncbi:spore coat U domain-containing protein [Acinetobacter bohemicus]|uniref:Spore coat protein U (SCPU) domain-containing protein n=1 Tax=Acinetobacter bohemicus TaxID=1435036 RepID=A0A1I6NVS8_9GAMM|nr:spore coat U domain-containing protein [Acinetobacter bohemicus]KAB0655095.1 spore coat U domain-containing protein [Acinetobacter bohemicus]SFS32053.1 Spore coat protein U (SCPU) domain-containing protein [Acinetobacter bohemicus]